MTPYPVRLWSNGSADLAPPWERGQRQMNEEIDDDDNDLPQLLGAEVLRVVFLLLTSVMVILVVVAVAQRL